MDITPRKIAPSEMKIVYAPANAPKFNPGRRAEIKYRDLGVEAATGGDVRAEMMHIDSTGISKPTGWHYHTADVQILSIVEGWVKMELPELGVVTLQAGDSITIPGGVVHQELCASGPMRLIEVTIPAKLGTVNVEAPAWASEKAESYGDISVVQKGGHSLGALNETEVAS